MRQNMNTDLLLCADDFALSASVSEAVLELAKAGRVNAALPGKPSVRFGMKPANGWAPSQLPSIPR